MEFSSDCGQDFLVILPDRWYGGLDGLIGNPDLQTLVSCQGVPEDFSLADGRFDGAINAIAGDLLDHFLVDRDVEVSVVVFFALPFS